MSSTTTTVIPPYEFTALETIPPTVSSLKRTFFTQRTHPLSFRKAQLRKLYWALKDHEADIVEALQKDFKKPVQEIYMGEIWWVQNDILYMLEHLDEWAKEEKGDVGWRFKAISPLIRKEPLGVVLIIGPFNFPIQLCLVPLIGAIAAGNCAVLKPSENSPHSAALLTHIIQTALDNDCYKVVNGAKEQTEALLYEKYDKIAFTGSTFVGRIVAKAAAKDLTPCVLELGGLNPAIVTKNANIALAARRTAWGRVHNAGQACISPNYVLCDPSKLDEFITEYKNTLTEWFGDDKAAASNQEGGARANLSRINNARSFHRIRSLLETTTGEILHGGYTDESDLYISPTLVKVQSPNDPLMKEEIFGPVLPVMAVENVDKAIELVREIGDTPLAVYAFTNDKGEQAKILESTRSGGATINDSMFHAAIPTLPFGGVGESGYGALRGKASFDAFVHRRTVVSPPGWIEKFLAMRYPPYNAKKISLYAQSNLTPNFDRNGKVRRSVLGLLLSLGSKSKRGAAIRWAMMLLGYYVATRNGTMRASLN